MTRPVIYALSVDINDALGYFVKASSTLNFIHLEVRILRYLHFNARNSYTFLFS